MTFVAILACFCVIAALAALRQGNHGDTTQDPPSAGLGAVDQLPPAPSTGDRRTEWDDEWLKADWPTLPSGRRRRERG